MYIFILRVRVYIAFNYYLYAYLYYEYLTAKKRNFHRWKLSTINDQYVLVNLELA